MTKDELRKHCERTCNRYRSAYINGNFDEVDKTYEEHKLVLKLIDQEETVLQALEDVRAKVHANILMFRNEHYENKEVATGCDKLIESINDYIDRKIKEIKHESTRSEN